MRRRVVYDYKNIIWFMLSFDDLFHIFYVNQFSKSHELINNGTHDISNTCVLTIIDMLFGTILSIQYCLIIVHA